MSQRDMDDLEQYIRSIILSQLNPSIEYGDLDVGIVDRIVFEIARYIRSMGAK